MQCASYCVSTVSCRSIYLPACITTVIVLYQIRLCMSTLPMKCGHIFLFLLANRDAPVHLPRFLLRFWSCAPVCNDPRLENTRVRSGNLSLLHCAYSSNMMAYQIQEHNDIPSLAACLGIHGFRNRQRLRATTVVARHQSFPHRSFSAPGRAQYHDTVPKETALCPQEGESLNTSSCLHNKLQSKRRARCLISLLLDLAFRALVCD